MDVDSPNLLKRCSSAPLINETASTTIQSPSTNTAPRSTCSNMFTSSEHRTRRFSASFSPSVPSLNLPRLAPRVNQLRQEECADVTNTREVAHEREVHSAMQMGASWEELNLVAGGNNNGSPVSPTRGTSFSPNGVSPSPTRRSFATRRSLSPISIRPSCLSPVGRISSLYTKKRISENDDMPSAKRGCWSDRLTPSTPGTPDSDSSECTFRPVSPRIQPMQQSPIAAAPSGNHKAQGPS